MARNTIFTKKISNVNKSISLLNAKKKNMALKLSESSNGLFKYDPLVVNLVNDRSLLNDNIYKIKNLVYNKNENTHNSPSTKEWTNSVYAYNKNYTKPLPATTDMVNKLLKGYFNLSPLINGKKSNVNAVLDKKLTLNRVFVSKAEVKHTSDKINLTVHIYNRKKKTLLKNLELLLSLLSNNSLRRVRKSKNGYQYSEKPIAFHKYINSNKLNVFNYYTSNLNLNSDIENINSPLKTKNLKDNAKSVQNSKEINLIYNYTPNFVNLFKINNKISKKRTIYIREYNWLMKFGISFKDKITQFKNEILETVRGNSVIANTETSFSGLLLNENTINKSFAKYESKYFSKYLNKVYLDKMLYLYYTKALLLNNNIFKNWFMLGLKKSLTQLYNKKVELNVVNQKYFYFNSDIFIKAISTRVRDRNNRILKELAYALNAVSIPKMNLYYKKKNIKVKSNDIFTYLKNDIFNSIKYKHINGVRVEAAGRLTKRLTAARSLFKVRNRGSLSNSDERFKNKNALMLRGCIKPNLQYTIAHSKTRNGAFGLKGWVNSN